MICTLLVLSSVSISLQIAGISGCDYVRIHLKALNENGIYFKDDPYVGLGLYNHQIFTEKNTMDWVHDPTCKKYDLLESDMFMEGNLSTNKSLSLSSIFINGIVILVLLFIGVLRLALIVKGSAAVESKATSAIFSIVISIILATSLALQVVAIDTIHDEGGICDRDSYFPDEWNVKFPYQIYPSYAYFKYFHECKIGADGHRAKNSLIFNSLACAIALGSAIVMLMQIPGREGSCAGGDIMAKFPVQIAEKTKKTARTRGLYPIESDIPSGESSDADATVPSECDESCSDPFAGSIVAVQRKRELLAGQLREKAINCSTCTSPDQKRRSNESSRHGIIDDDSR